MRIGGAVAEGDRPDFYRAKKEEAELLGYRLPKITNSVFSIMERVQR